MRREPVALCLSLLAAAGAAAAATPPISGDSGALPSGFSWPPGFVPIADGGNRRVDFGADEWGWPDPQAGGSVRHEALEGRVWVMVARLDPPVKPVLAEAEVFARLRAALSPLGWRWMSRAPYTIMHRGEPGQPGQPGQTEGWLKMGGASDHFTITVIEPARSPRSFDVPPPAPSLDAWIEGQAPPYLPAYPGAVLAGAHVTPQRFEFREAGGEATYVGAPMMTLDWKGDRAVSAHELCKVMGDALTRAGWKIVVIGCRGYGGDGTLLGRYTQGGHDLYLNLHAMGDLYHATIADNALAAEARRLEEALRRDGHVAVYGIYFDVDKDILKGESEATLQQILKLLESAPQLHLGIEGHTDSTGSRPHNQTLSEARAASVVKWLTAHRIAAARLGAAGFADTRPVADNKTPEGRSRNRRVELVRK